MKRILCFLLAFISVFSLAVPVIAADESTDVEIMDDYDLDTSTISEDFDKIFNKKFKVEDYPYESTFGSSDDNDDIYLIMCLEHNHGKEDFNLYFYFYNPTRKNIDFYSSKNEIRIMSKVLGSTDNNFKYEDFPIEFISSEQDGLLLKYKVKNFKALYHPLFNESREYYISGVELLTSNSIDATDYILGSRFIYKENENGFTVCYYENAVTVSTEVNHTYYRFPTDDENEYYDMRAVYFNVPNEIVGKYGFIESLRCKWEECKSLPSICTDNEVVMETLADYVIGGEGGDKLSFFYNFLEFFPVPPIHSYKYVFNHPLGMKDWPFVVPFPFYAYAYSSLDFLGGAFKIDKWTEKGEIAVPSEDLKAFYESYGYSDFMFSMIDSYYYDSPKKFYVSHSISNNNYVIPSITSILLSKSNTREFLIEFMDNPENFTPLVKVDPEDFKLSDKEFSNKYVVLEKDVKNIKDSYDSNSTMYLLHYTVTDYKMYDDIKYIIEPFDGTLLGTDHNEFIFEHTVIRNFDLIEAEYLKNGVLTLLPFSSDKSHGVVDIITPEPDPDIYQEILDYLKLIINILIVCVILYILLKIFSFFKPNKIIYKKKGD